MILYSRIMIIGMLLLSVVTTSCDSGHKSRTDEIRESIADVMNGFRDGFYDSTVVVMINDTVASAADAEMVASTISMTTTGSGSTFTTTGSGRRGSGVTTINIMLPDNANGYGSDVDSSIPSFIPSVAVVGTVMVFGMPVLAIFLICYFIYRTKRARYQAVSQIVASGQPVPVGLFPQADPRAKWSSGVKYLAWGVALMLFFIARARVEFAMLMLVPIVIGVGKLLAYRSDRKSASGGDMPPHDYDGVHDDDSYTGKDNSTNFPPIPPRR
ncbi:DUF6249 domain-containing protein [uncultured Muribaculum sp.]|uniref:DUF6249 domain-containing protein n=1 Tax=uncultured Muribaculum sp. TaxID=1918613 RepID=UPI0026313482|nr:DUF6249 domain-containing protein [uncultured Muribaculum sp.]